MADEQTLIASFLYSFLPNLNFWMPLYIMLLDYTTIYTYMTSNTNVFMMIA